MSDDYPTFLECDLRAVLVDGVIVLQTPLNGEGAIFHDQAEVRRLIEWLQQQLPSVQLSDIKADSP